MFQQAVRVRVFQFAMVSYQGPAHVAAACSIIMVWITGPFEELGIDSLSAAKIFLHCTNGGGFGCSRPCRASVQPAPCQQRQLPLYVVRFLPFTFIIAGSAHLQNVVRCPTQAGNSHPDWAAASDPAADVPHRSPHGLRQETLSLNSRKLVSLRCFHEPVP